MLHVGFKQYVRKNKVLSITKANTAPLARARREAEDVSKAIDCTYGRKARSLLFLDGGFIVLSAHEPDVLKERWERVE